MDMRTPPPSTAAQRLCVIYNPVAGWRKRGRFRRTLAALRDLGCELRVLETRHAGHAEVLAREAPACDRLVVAGGDGTLNEVLNGLAGRGDAPPVALIPLGTANVVARELGLSLKPERVARAIVHGPATPAHLGAANGRHFAQMAGIGFDAQLVARVSPGVKRVISQGAYVLAFLRMLATFRSPDYQVRVDGVAHTAKSLIVAKGRRYGGPFVLAPEARPWRPDFQVCLYDRSGVPAIVGYGLALLTGRTHRRRDVRILSARRVEVRDAAGEPVQLDGDAAARLPVDIRLVENAVRFVLPEDAQLPASVMPSTRSVGESVP